MAIISDKSDLCEGAAVALDGWRLLQQVTEIGRHVLADNIAQHIKPNGCGQASIERALPLRGRYIAHRW
jgi:hypothetical protein